MRILPLVVLALLGLTPAARCPSRSGAVALGDGNDRATLAPGSPLSIDGGPGTTR